MCNLQKSLIFIHVSAIKLCKLFLKFTSGKNAPFIPLTDLGGSRYMCVSQLHYLVLCWRCTGSSGHTRNYQRSIRPMIKHAAMFSLSLVLIKVQPNIIHSFFSRKNQVYCVCCQDLKNVRYKCVLWLKNMACRVVSI